MNNVDDDIHEGVYWNLRAEISVVELGPFEFTTSRTALVDICRRSVWPREPTLDDVRRALVTMLESRLPLVPGLESLISALQSRLPAPELLALSVKPCV